MPTLKPDDLSEITPELVGDLNRETLEKLALQVVELALHLASRLNLNSANSFLPAVERRSVSASGCPREGCGRQAQG